MFVLVFFYVGKFVLDSNAFSKKTIDGIFSQIHLIAQNNIKDGIRMHRMHNKALLQIVIEVRTRVMVQHKHRDHHGAE